MIFIFRIEDIVLPVKVSDKDFLTISLEIRTQKLEEPSIVVTTELDQALEEKLEEKFRESTFGFRNYDEWRESALQDGTIREELGIDGSCVSKISKKITKVETEKIIVNFPIQVKPYIEFSKYLFCEQIFM